VATTKTNTESEPRLLLLVGSPTVTQSEADRFIGTHVPVSLQSTHVDIVDGAQSVANDLFMRLSTVPFGGGKLVLWVRGALDKDTATKFFASLPGVGLPEHACLIHTIEEGPDAVEKNFFEKNGTIRNLSGADAARTWLLSRANKLGVTLSPDAYRILSRLFAKSPNEVNVLLEKVVAYIYPETAISDADLHRVAAHDLLDEEDPFALSGAVLARDLEGLLSGLREQIAQKGELASVGTLCSVARTLLAGMEARTKFRDLPKRRYDQVKDELSQLAKLIRAHPYQVFLAARSRWKQTDAPCLVDLIQELANLDVRLKSGGACSLDVEVAAVRAIAGPGPAS